jgi:hypothetical protein
MPKSNKTMEDTLKKMEQAGLIVQRKENNPYLSIFYRGTGGLVSEKWNIKIYNTGSFVCDEPLPIREFLHGRLKEPDKSLKLLQVDDAGIGSPIGGCMVGACDGEKVVTDIVDVSFFKPGSYDRREYFKEYTRKGLRLIEKVFNAAPETHRIEICTGFINKGLREELRRFGYDVRVVDIKGLLQDQLENIFRNYLKKITGGVDLGYDPKECKSKKEISDRYYKSVNWAKKNAPHLLKTGWASLRS